MTNSFRLPIRVFVVALLSLLAADGARALAQAPDAAAAPAPPPERDDTEQNLVSVPTTQPMPRFGSHFRITHRFARDIRRGDFSDLASDLFGLDEGAIIGLDYRFAPTSKIQLGAYRTMLYRTVQFSSRYDMLPQKETRPVAISALVSVEGADNFREDYATAIGAVVSRAYGRRLAVYASPTFVWNSVTPGVTGDNLPAGTLPDEENTSYIGLGTRVLIPRSIFIALEYTPRMSGFAPGRGTWGVGIEKHTRGHLFQLNLSNSFGTTYGQLARGGEPSNIYLGFNIARKF